MKEKVILSNEPVDLWNLTEPMSDFEDYEVLQMTCYTLYNALGDDFEGSIVGYAEPEENKDYSFEYASGRYSLTLYTPDGQVLEKHDLGGDKFVKWVGLRRVPFIGYVYRDKRSDYSLPEGTIWFIVPKSKDQLLSTVAAFYKRRRKKDKAPNIVDLSSYFNKPTSVEEVEDYNSFVPLRIRKYKGVKRPSATKKNLEKYRSTAPEITDALLAEAVNEKYGDFFIDNEEIAREAVKELLRCELPLTTANVLQQIDYFISDRKCLELYKALQDVYSEEANERRRKTDKLVETIYETACKRVFDLSEIADDETIELLTHDYKKRNLEIDLAHIVNNLCLNYHCRKYHLVSCIEDNNFPPFRCFNYNYGKDVTFAPTFEEAKAYHDKQRSEANTTTPQENKAPQENSNSKKGGCLLWFILLPPTITGLLFAMI